MTKTRLRAALATAAGWLAVSASAQVQVDLVTEQKQFLPGEELRVGVRIGNLSGQALKFGEGADWVSFHFDPNDKIRVRQVAGLPAIETFEVENATRATRWYDLAPCFDISKPGRYRLSSVVKIRAWKEERLTSPVELEIIQATTVWEQEFGVPPRAGEAAGSPEVRKYAIQQARSDGELRLYLRVTDRAGEKTFRVTPIDRYLQLSKPEMRIDRKSRLHVLHRTGRSEFSYAVFDPDGTTLVRQRHDYNELTGSGPALRVVEEGEIIVHGGVRKFLSTDVPASDAERQPN